MLPLVQMLSLIILMLQIICATCVAASTSVNQQRQHPQHTIPDVLVYQERELRDHPNIQDLGALIQAMDIASAAVAEPERMAGVLRELRLTCRADLRRLD